MSENATNAAELKAAQALPAGLALMNDNVAQDYHSELAALMAQIDPAVNEAMGLGSLEPKLEPDSQRDSKGKENVRKTEVVPANVTLGQNISAVLSSFANRVQHKRAQNVSSAVRTMFAATVAYEMSAKAYNSVARARAPALFGEVAALAKKTGKTEQQVLARAMDTRIQDPDPDLKSIRSGLKTLSSDPDLIYRRQQMNEMARQFENRSGQIAKWAARVEAGQTQAKPEQVANAINSLHEVLNNNIASRVASLPGLDAQMPSANPGGALSRFATGLADLGKRIQDFIHRLTGEIAPAAGLD